MKIDSAFLLYQYSEALETKLICFAFSKDISLGIFMAQLDIHKQENLLNVLLRAGDGVMHQSDVMVVCPKYMPCSMKVHLC